MRGVRSRLVTAAAVCAVALTAAASMAFGATLTGSTLTLAPGESVTGNCATPNTLTTSGKTAHSVTLKCSGTATTTTVAPVTTTLPVTTTTLVLPVPSTTGGCGLALPAFCETFDGPVTNSSFNSRSGHLNGVLWGTSYGIADGGDSFATVSSQCAAGNVTYPANLEICNGQLVDTTNDVGTVTSLAAYPRQPFDFAGRTGTITFDVSNDTQGNHAAWPELWVSDQPVPDPFSHEASFQAFPRNGFGVRFAGCTDSSGAGATCLPDGNNGVGVDSAITVNNYAGNDSFNGGSLKVIGDHDVLLAGTGQMNHYQITVSQGDIEVYGTNPFSGGWNPTANPLVHIASIPNTNLGFSRGLVWLEDVHYNGNKFGTQRIHTFRWDNLGFDGPALPRDLGFDVAANAVPNANIDGSGVAGVDTGYLIAGNGSQTFPVTGVTATNLAAAKAALFEYNFWALNSNPANLTITVNGNPISVPWPYPDATVDSPRTIAIPVPLTDLVVGTNSITIAASGPQTTVANLDLILAGAG